MSHYLLSTNRQTHPENRGYAPEDNIDTKTYGVYLTDEEANTIGEAVAKQFQEYLNAVGAVSEKHGTDAPGAHTLGIGWLELSPGWDSDGPSDLTPAAALELVKSWSLWE